MCGICGVIACAPDEPIGSERLERMNAAQAHRGPDDSGTWADEAIALGHRRLSILDTSAAGHQPMISHDGRLVAVYNGEIYNFQALRRDLEGRGCCFRTQCDTEVLLEAFGVWGDAALERFNGIFAIALYDRAKRRLLLARDRLGVKPLFYTIQNRTLAFASELAALRAGGFAGTGLSAAALDAYFTYQYVPGPETIYENVRQLQPGEMLVWEGGRISSARYWRLEYRIDPGWTLESAAERYRALLEDAVRLQRVSDVPLGAFLSGGIDSTTVVAMLSEISGEPPATFTIGFDDTHMDELAFARIAAQRFQTDHTEEILRPDMAALLPRLIRHFGQPFADSSALPMWLVSRMARRRVTVALSGDGGDELFAGYTWAHMNHRVARYRRMPPPLRRLAHAALRCAPKSPRVEKLRRFSADSFLPPAESFRRRLSTLAGEQRAALYTPDFGQSLGRDAVDRFSEHWDACGGLSEDDHMLYLDTRMYLPDDILTKVDRMSMAHGLEARVPLLDHRLVEFAATVPFHLKYRNGISKRLVKHAFRGLLPPELMRQRKQGFAIPIQRWFREELRACFQETVLVETARCAPYLRRDTIQRLFDAHLARREDHGHALWAVLVFEQWLRLEAESH